MGTTTTSLHVLIPPFGEELAADTIAKAVEKLGYKRVVKPGAAGDKHVVLLRPAGARYVTVLDRDNAALDSGELRELAALVTQKLKTAALHTSVIDSDSGEVVVYHKGKQVDAVGGSVEGDSLVRIAAEARVRSWRRILHDGVTKEGVAAAAGTDSVFADDVVAGWCRAAGLDPAAALGVFDEAAAHPAALHLRYARDAARRKVPAPPSAEIDLRFFTDDEDRPEHLVYPAAWPVRMGTTHVALWYAVSEGAGFSSVRIRLGVDPACGLAVFRVGLSSSPFHNGQVMGDPVAVFDWRASPEQPQWKLDEAVEIADFEVPTPAAGSRSRQILILRLAVGAQKVAEGEVHPVLEVTAPSAYTHAFTPLRFAVIEPTWTPLAMGTWPVLRPTPANPVGPKEYARNEGALLLNGSGVVSAFAVLADPDVALASVRELAASLLSSCNGDARVVLRTETPMSWSGNSSKTTFETTATECLDSPRSGKAFTAPARYQNVTLEIQAAGLAAPVAGLLYYLPHGHDSASGLHVCAWCIDASPVADGIGLTAGKLRSLFERWIAGVVPLQGWIDDSAWRPEPLTGDGGGATPYELAAGVYGEAIASQLGARTDRLRYVADLMWLGGEFLSRVDRPALERVALLQVDRGVARVALREGAARNDLERALEAILPGPAPLPAS